MLIKDMEREEVGHVLAAVIVFTVILAIKPFISGEFSFIGYAFISAAVVVATNIYGKKIMANFLDADVEHRTWEFSQYGLKMHKHLNKPWLVGIFLPLILSILSLGFVKIPTFLTYETSAKKVRASKRFGYYSYTEMTDWHNALIGAAGTIVTLIVLVISYLSDFEPMAKAAALYAFWNMLPISTLDGVQVFFGSKILWSVLAILVSIAALYSVILI